MCHIRYLLSWRSVDSFKRCFYHEIQIIHTLFLSVDKKSFHLPFRPPGSSHYIRLCTSLTRRESKIRDIKIQSAEPRVIEIQHHADNWIITLMKFLHWLKVRVPPSLILKSLFQTWKCVRTGGSFFSLAVASRRNLLPHRRSRLVTHHFQTWQPGLTFQLGPHFTFFFFFWSPTSAW